MTTDVKVLPPHVLGNRQLCDFARAVGIGGEVDTDALIARVRQAAWLAVVTVDGVPAGVGALKRPTDNHRLVIGAQSGFDLSQYPYELGWIVILPKYRGNKLSQLLVAALLEKAGTAGVFCTVRAENHAVQKACARFGFADTGARWQGERGPLGLGIWQANNPAILQNGVI